MLYVMAAGSQRTGGLARPMKSSHPGRKQGGSTRKPVVAKGPIKSATKRIPIMSDVSATKTKTKVASFTPETPKLEIPRFDVPKFDIPKMEVPAAFRELAEKSVTQAKDNWEKMKAATEEATDLIEGSYATATKGASEYGLKVIEAARSNTNAYFDYATQMMTVKSLAEAVELSTAQMRKQFDTLTAQTKELSALAQKVANDTCEPIKESVTSAFKKVA
jgi:phasin